jgi:hypothetical protein
MPYDPTTNPLNSAEWIFPTLEVFHISFFAASIGLISVVNLRLANLTLKEIPVKQLNRKLFLWTLGGLTVVLLAGMMLFTTDPYRYYYNSGFRFKMAALLVGIVYQYTVHSVVIAKYKEGSAIAILSAIISTGLWVAVTFGGIFFAFE